MARTTYNCSPERFVEVWERSRTSDAAAKQLGMPKSIAHARASSYRAQGIKLKRMPRRGPRPLDVEGLNRLVETICTGGTDMGNDDGGTFRF
jgi:hypothetical protein